MSNENKLSVNRAAELMNVGSQFLRLGLQQGKFPFGWAVKTSTKWTYYISKSKFTEHTGIKVGDEVDENPLPF